MLFTLVLGACGGGTSFAPTPLSFTPGTEDTEQDWSQAITVGPTNTAWTAFSSEPWLDISPRSGQAAPNVRLVVSLLPDAIQGMVNGTYKATVVVAFKDGAGPERYVLVPVTLNLNLARPYFLAPRIATAGTSGEVIVRGMGFDALTTPMVIFGGTAATHVTRISPTELRATFPSLPAGTYRVHVEGARDTADGRLALVVVEPQVYPAAVIPTPTRNTRIAYDAEHRALYVLGSETQTLERYAYDSTNKAWSRTATALPRINDFALRPDGQGILALSNTTVHNLDDMSLEETWSRNRNQTFDAPGASIQFGNNGKAYMLTKCEGGRLYTFDLLTRRTTDGMSEDPFADSYRCGALTATENGSRILLSQSGSRGLYYLDISGGFLEHSRLDRSPNSVALDRTGARGVLDGYEVIDSDFNVLGTLSSASLGAALSPDGTRAYTYDSTSAGVRLRTFDLTRPPPVAGTYPELGTGLLLTTTPENTRVVMTVSPDGTTLFIAGGQRVHVQPLPLP